MVPATKKLPFDHPHPENVPILLASPCTSDQSALRSILHHPDWIIAQGFGVSEAVQLLDPVSPAVIVCEASLPDGTWRDVLRAAAARPSPPELIVASRHADDALWVEVLNLGGYDVLVKPFDKGEVLRVIGMAWRQWRSRNIHAPRQPSAPGRPTAAKAGAPMTVWPRVG